MSLPVVRPGLTPAARPTEPLGDKEVKTMIRSLAMGVLALTAAGLPPSAAFAQPMSFKMLSNYSRATFKTDAPLETIVGTTAGAAVSGNLTVDPLKPAGGKGTIKVDLATLSSGVTKRDQDMQAPRYLDTANEANRFAVFEIKSIDMEGPLEAGKEARAKVKGILTIKQKPSEVVADARVTYVRLTAEQVEAQKRFGFARDNLKVRAKFGTTFTNHNMTIPEMLCLKA